MHWIIAVPAVGCYRWYDIQSDDAQGSGRGVNEEASRRFHTYTRTHVADEIKMLVNFVNK